MEHRGKGEGGMITGLAHCSASVASKTQSRRSREIQVSQEPRLRGGSAEQ